MKVRTRTHAGRGLRLALAAALTTLGVAAPARAQQKTFYLDRLEMGGAPDDALGIPRLSASTDLRVFAQGAFGFSYNPLRSTTVAPSGSDLSRQPNPVTSQVINYLSGGFEVGERFAVVGVLPIALYETGSDPGPIARGVALSRAAAHDLRVDARVLALGSDAGRFRLGVIGSMYAPTGNAYSYGSDGGIHGSVAIAAEGRPGGLLLLTNVGVHLRPPSSMGQLAIGDELRVAAGLFVPMREDRTRVGVEVFASTGLGSPHDATGAAPSTFLSLRNTPAEWLAEARFALDDKRMSWLIFGGGTRLDPGYGAPDVRVVAGIGAALSTADAAPAPVRQRHAPAKPYEGPADADHDGIPDETDLCPNVAEDREQPEPNDGCPRPQDRDHDGIVDDRDRCPDLAEDLDGFEDHDGCPDVDVDGDGVPDEADACPTEPGAASDDPGQSGCPQRLVQRVVGSDEIRIKQQIEFDLGRATIRPVSAPVLDEIAKLLASTPALAHVRVEGHTDDRGKAASNQKLSQQRAEAVVAWLVAHGIDASRLEAQGLGSTRPLVAEKTDAARKKNRRVELHVVEQAD